MSREGQGERFRMGYGWTPALSDPDPRVRHAARQALYGQTAGKVKRYGRKRARSPRLPGAFDAAGQDMRALIGALERSKDLRQRWRRHITKAYGITFEEVRRVASIKGRPSNDLKPMRIRIALAFAEIVARETVHAQRGRRIARQSLMALYDLDEQQFDRLLRTGRAALESEGSVARGGVRQRATLDATEPEHYDDDEDAGLDVGLTGDAPAFDEKGRLR